MDYQSVFKRYELKFIIDEQKRARVLDVMSEYMKADKYHKSTVRNIYLDTDSFRLIRRSIDKPVYKEKIRLRSYRKTDDGGEVFVELKKKYKSVVYKRRVSMRESDAAEWLTTDKNLSDSQIKREINYFKNMYAPLSPKLFLSYEREAYSSKTDDGVRITFDNNILARQSELSLSCDTSGMNILDNGLYLMEVKCAGAMPLWLVRTLSEERIYKTSFSKYGTAYKKYIFNSLKENNNEGLTV